MGEPTKSTPRNTAFRRLEEHYDVEQRKAIRRIAAIPEGAMDWIFTFVGTDLEALGSGGWIELQHELAAFAAQGHFIIQSMEDPTLIRLGKSRRYECGWEYSELNDQPAWDKLSPEEILLKKGLPWPATVRRLQTTCLDILERFTRDEDVLIPMPQGTLHITTRGDWIEAKRGEDAFFGHFIMLFQSEKRHVKRCPECQTFFLPGRTDAKFCSVRCQSRFNMRSYREAALEKAQKTKKKTSNPPARPKKKTQRSTE